MLEEIIKTKLNKLNVKFVKSGDTFLLSQCLNPNHNDKKPSFSINTNSGKAFCYTCGYRLDKDFWLDKEYNKEELERASYYQQLKNKLKTTENKDKIESKANIILPPKSEDITSYRGLSKQLIDDLDIYVCCKGKFRNRLIIPIKENNEVVAFETRSLDKNNKIKYLHSKNFQVKDIIYPQPNNNYVVLTEGVFDALSYYDIGISSLTNWGVAYNFSNKKISQLIYLGVETIYLGFDRDEAGSKAVELFKKSELNDYFEVKTLDKLDEDIVKLYLKSKYKDFSEFYEHYKGEYK